MPGLTNPYDEMSPPVCFSAALLNKSEQVLIASRGKLPNCTLAMSLTVSQPIVDLGIIGSLWLRRAGRARLDSINEDLLREIQNRAEQYGEGIKVICNVLDEEQLGKTDMMQTSHGPFSKHYS